MLHNIFLIGGIWFYILLAIEVLILWGCMSFENGFLATLSILVVFSILGVLGNFNILEVMHQHPAYIGALLSGYFAVGLIWSFIKFRIFVAERREELDELTKSFIEYEHIKSTSVPPEKSTEWKRFLERSDFSKDLRTVTKDNYEVISVSPLAKRHKGQIITWMTYWPWSVSWALMHDLVRKIFEEIYRIMHDWYQKISDKSFEGTEIAVLVNTVE